FQRRPSLNMISPIRFFQGDPQLLPVDIAYKCWKVSFFHQSSNQHCRIRVYFSYQQFDGEPRHNEPDTHIKNKGVREQARLVVTQILEKVKLGRTKNVNEEAEQYVSDHLNPKHNYNVLP